MKPDVGAALSQLDQYEDALDLLEGLMSYDKLDRLFDREDLDKTLALLHKHGRMTNVISLY